MEEVKIKLKKEGKIIAIKDNKQIGYLDYGNPKDKSKKRNLEVTYIYVDPKYRRKKIGTSMMEFLFKKIKNIVWLSFWTSQDIEEMRGTKFYKKLGFKKKAYQKDYYKNGVGTTLFVKRMDN